MSINRKEKKKFEALYKDLSVSMIAFTMATRGVSNSMQALISEMDKLSNAIVIESIRSKKKPIDPRLKVPHRLSFLLFRMSWLPVKWKEKLRRAAYDFYRSREL